MLESLIVGHGENFEIGKDNQLLWHLPEDLKKFKQITSGNIIVMGRKTFESIGRPLPNRENWILSTTKNYAPEGTKVFSSLEDLRRAAKMSSQKSHLGREREIIYIGGESIYELALKFVKRMYISIIHKSYPADTFFPQYKAEEFELIKSESHLDNDKLPWEFKILERIK